MNVLVWAREASLKLARGDGYAAAPGKQAFFSAVRRHFAPHALVEGTRGIVTGRRPCANETDGPAGQYQPRSADRARPH